MPLLDHQMALGQCLRGTDAEARTAPILDAKEQGQIDRIVESAGFRFTRRVQRSWCRGRVASVARLTLSALPPEQAQKLLGDWIEMGGGTASHTAAEAGAFLEFIARDLPDPSHARTICRMEQAIYRASEAATDFECPDLRLLDDPAAALCAGQGAARVDFFAEPQQLLTAIEEGKRLPPLSETYIAVLFAPGLAGLFRAASADEIALWEELGTPTTIRILDSLYGRDVIKELFRIGAAELAVRQDAGRSISAGSAHNLSADTPPNTAGNRGAPLRDADAPAISRHQCRCRARV